MLRSLPEYLRTAKEREKTALTDLSLTVLPNLFRGYGDGWKEDFNLKADVETCRSEE